jgi:hypothetical protein
MQSKLFTLIVALFAVRPSDAACHLATSDGWYSTTSLARANKVTSTSQGVADGLGGDLPFGSGTKTCFMVLDAGSASNLVTITGTLSGGWSE